MMQIAVPLFDRFTALDAVGPYEVLSRLPGATVRFLGPAAGAVRTDTRMLTIETDGVWEDVPAPDVLLVPGGFGTRGLLKEERILRWLRQAHEQSVWTTSVCTGSLLLAAAGILDGVDAATHWAARDLLESLGARPVAERVVERGKIITAAGASAGIDMALVLAGRIAGDEVAQAIQLSIEYDPDPPYRTGSLEKAPSHIADLVRSAEAAQSTDSGAG
jgi:putative intracellular protease/amidase